MLDYTFYLDGVDARTAGIRLQAPIEFSDTKPIINAQTVPGRNGDLLFDTGSYQNRTGKADCFVLQKDVEKALSAAGRFLMGKRGYRRLETSDDPDHYWIAMVENSPQIEMRGGVIAPFDIKFDCKPQRFVKSGESPIVFVASGGLFTNSSIFNQYGQVALPLIKVYGTGIGFLTVGDTAVGINNLDGILYLDSETQNAYNESGNQNMNINAPVFPMIPDGETSVSIWGGIEKIEIIPRWWEL